MPTYGYAANRPSRLVLATILGGHFAILGALWLAKIEVFPEPPPTGIKIRNIPIDPPPPLPVDPPPPPDAKAQPQPLPPQSAAPITVVEPVFPTTGPVVTPGPVTTVDPPLPPGPVTRLAEVVVPAIPRDPPVTILPPRPAPVGVKPRGDPGAWVTNDDYPDAALRGEEQGRTAFRLDVGADGRPTACSVTASSGSRVLDAAACKLLMRRARFVAGRDGDGAAVGGTYANSFKWEIPEG